MRCRFCGYEGSEDDFEEDYIHHLGYWCPYCDAFSYISDENEKRRQFLLWLEDIKNGQPLTEKKDTQTKRIPAAVSRRKNQVGTICSFQDSRRNKAYCRTILWRRQCESGVFDSWTRRRNSY